MQPLDFDPYPVRGTSDRKSKFYWEQPYSVVISNSRISNILLSPYGLLSLTGEYVSILSLNGTDRLITQNCTQRDT